MIHYLKHMILMLTTHETNETHEFCFETWGATLSESFEQRLSGEYQLLSTKLQQAADFVVSHPVDIATRSLRSISKDAGLAPATFSRMSRAIGYDSYEELREVMRSSISTRANSFSDRIVRLQKEHGEEHLGFLPNHFMACSDNLRSFVETIDMDRMEVAVDRLHASRRVLVAGSLGSTGIAEYLAYMASFITDKWSMANRMGASLASGLVGLQKDDALIVITKPPFASQSILAAKEAQDCGAYVIVITDTHSCPALAHASEGFIIPTESQHFFSSYAATLVLAESIIGMLASRAGPDARERINLVEDRNRRLNEVWGG